MVHYGVGHGRDIAPVLLYLGIVPLRNIAPAGIPFSFRFVVCQITYYPSIFHSMHPLLLLSEGAVLP
jgi:hypothetical protein